jgi:hypothetical protein
LNCGVDLPFCLVAGAGYRDCLRRTGALSVMVTFQ